MRRTGLGEGDVDDVVLGNCYPSGENPAIGRIAALDAGLGTGVPGLQLDRRCGSGAGRPVRRRAGRQRRRQVIVAGGVESMSNVEHYALGLRTGIRSGGVELMDRLVRARETAGGKDHPVPGGMLETAENLRREYGITREEQDESRSAPSSGPAPPMRPASSPTSWSRSPFRAVAASPTSWSIVTSTPAPTPPSSNWRPCGRCARSRRRIDRHGRQRERPERRGRHVRRHDPGGGRTSRASPPARTAGRGRSPASARR